MTTTPDTLLKEAGRLDAVGTEVKWRRYPGYSPSGIDWLGEMPNHWRSSRLKYSVARIQSGGTPDTNKPEFWAWGDESGVPWVAIADMTRTGVVSDTEKHLTTEGLASKKLPVLPSGTLLYSMYASLGKVAILDVDAVVNQAILGIVPDTSHAVQDYLAYWLRFMEEHLELFSSSNTQDNLNAAKVRSMPVLLPPLHEQQAIAAFLDRKTREIDELIEKKRRLIALLQEQRTALISHAVTKGLNPDAPMKPSGVDWLGDVPEHWDVKPLMHLTEFGHKIMYGIVLPGPHFDDGVPIVKGGDVTPERLRRELLRCTDPEIEAHYERSRLREGDLVYAIRGSIGACELVPADCAGANVTQDTAKIAPEPLLNRRWMKYAMKSAGVFAQLEQGALGATIQGINIRDLKRCKLPVPPADEQERIAIHLDGVTARLDALLQTAETGRARLVEYRQAMISAAVTGKIDVRDTGRTTTSSGRVAMEDTNP